MKKMQTERELIKNLIQMSEFIGDDCALLPLNKKENYLITKDIIAEDTHFSLEYFTPEDIIKNLFIRNISDIIASGGVPKYAFIGAALTESYFQKNIKALTRQMFKCAEEYGIKIAGGDTVSSKKKLFFSMTLAGTALKKEIKKRKGVKEGDYLCLLGGTGRSLWAFEELKKGILKNKKWHTEPELFIKESRLLSKNKNVSAMIDLSDSLKETVEILCGLNKIGCLVNMDSLPLWRDMDFFEKQKYLVCGGEDYALLFALKGKDKIKGVPYKIIGRFTRDKKITYLNGNKPVKIKDSEYKHF